MLVPAGEHGRTQGEDSSHRPHPGPHHGCIFTSGLSCLGTFRKKRLGGLEWGSLAMGGPCSILLRRAGDSYNCVFQFPRHLFTGTAEEICYRTGTADSSVWSWVCRESTSGALGAVPGFCREGIAELPALCPPLKTINQHPSMGTPLSLPLLGRNRLLLTGARGSVCPRGVLPALGAGPGFSLLGSSPRQLDPYQPSAGFCVWGWLEPP